ncbi:hypothetical protein [Burkholderia lata]|uniref:Uncharacterized protein n=1 Tax=Burkholderia lata (strain ATCC 17760 / DSM 23089 / LMG 22485 / NCIMB 9086 / R18194 / 383) TaxID=482957 RepID=Q39LW4_BURL3|nr:hypothetical protein [Burkholderia lata]ABB06552.1 hypothetical protein Bcep18194_C7508 [Burkholderia lata]
MIENEIRGIHQRAAIGPHPMREAPATPFSLIVAHPINASGKPVASDAVAPDVRARFRQFPPSMLASLHVLSPTTQEPVAE